MPVKAGQGMPIRGPVAMAMSSQNFTSVSVPCHEGPNILEVLWGNVVLVVAIMPVISIV